MTRITVTSGASEGDASAARGRTRAPRVLTGIFRNPSAPLGLPPAARPRVHDPGAARTPLPRARAPPEVTRGGCRGLRRLHGQHPPEEPCPGVETPHAPAVHRRRRAQPAPAGPARRKRWPEALRGTVAAQGHTLPPGRALLTPTRATQEAGLLGLGLGHLPSRTSRRGRSWPGGSSAPGAVAAAGSPRPRGRSPSARDSSESARGGHVTEAPPPRAAGDVTARRCAPRPRRRPERSRGLARVAPVGRLVPRGLWGFVFFPQ